MDTLEKIEEYLASVEEYFFSSLSAVAHGLPDVHEVADRLWIDISRYGPGLPAFPEVRIPSLGDFQVPPPPPPPPPPPAFQWLHKSSDWIVNHPWKTAGFAVSVVGTGLLASYSITRTKKRGSQRLRTQQAKSSPRRQAVGETCSNSSPTSWLINPVQLFLAPTRPLGCLSSWIWRRGATL